MLKRAVTLFLLLVFVLSVGAGCGSGGSKSAVPAAASKSNTEPVGPGPSSPDLKQTAAKVLTLTETKEWASLYDYVYREIQIAVPKDEFVDLRKQETSRSKIVYKNYQIGEPKMLVESIEGGITYKNVAEVPYVVDVETPRGEIKVNNHIHLIQSPEKNWRYLWIKR